MSKKDFQVRVHVIEARELKGREGAGTSDPICFVTVAGKKQHTEIKKKTLNCTWDHLFFWDLKLYREEFMDSTIKVEIFDANTFKRDSLIGTYEFGVAWVYDQEGHELYRKWVGLQDVTDEFEGVQGYCKLSVTCLGPGDVAPSHDADEDDEDDDEGTDLASMVLMPPNIPKQEYNLRFRVFRAVGLPKMDMGVMGKGSCDGFVRVLYGGTQAETKVVKGTLDPDWNQELQLPVVTPTMSDRIQFQVYDHDTGTKDELICQSFLSLASILEAPFGPSWVHMYGAHGTGTSKTERLMNQAALEGTTHRGRVLLEVIADPVEAATLEVNEAGGGADPPCSSYTLRFDLYQAVDIKNESNARVEVFVGADKVASKNASIKKGVASWYESLDDLVVSCEDDVEHMPDILVHVSVKRVKWSLVGYLRFKASELLGWRESKPQWVMLKKNPEHENDSEAVAGFLLFNMGFGLSSSAPPPSPKLEAPPTRKVQLRAHIYQARNLPAADEQGTSDPYCTVRLGTKHGKTRRIEGTCFPQWYETLKMDVEVADDLNIAPNINVMVYDWDRMSGDDLLGRFEVPLRMLKPGMPKTPSWYSLYMDDPKDKEGAVLASFQLVPEEQVGSIEIPDIKPPTKECVFEISCVGLRNMLPFRMLKMQSPYIEFDCGDRKVKVRTKHCKKPTGSDPNHLQVMSLPVALPLNPLFAPAVNVRVYDYRMGGASTPLVGSSSIPIAPFIPWVDDAGALDAQLKEVDMAAAIEADESEQRAKEAEVDEEEERADTCPTCGHSLLEHGHGEAEAAAETEEEAEAEAADAAEEEEAEAAGGEAGEQTAAGMGGDDDDDDEEEAAAPEDEADESAAADTPQTGAGDAPRTPGDVTDSGRHVEAPLGMQGLFTMSSITRVANEMGMDAKDVAIMLYPEAYYDEIGRIATKSKGRKRGKVGDSKLDGDDEEDDKPQMRTPGEMENTLKPPFEQYDLWRGKTRGLSAVQKKLKEKTGASFLTIGGQLKCKFRVLEAASAQMAGDAPDLQKLYGPQDVEVRVYIYRGTNLIPKDDNGSSDPYVKLRIGSGKEAVEVDDVQNKKLKTLQPEWFKCYQLKAKLPGQSRLTVALWDWDMASGDDLIGETHIDLENRWFSEEWKALPKKPIEKRTLWSPASSNAQGKVEMHVDILTLADARSTPPDKIAPPAPQKYELRVIVWRCKDIVFKDKSGSDVFLTGLMEGHEKEKIKTDTHWKSDGKAEFNWRMKFAVMLPEKLPRLKIAIWDADMIGPNDSIAEASINLKGLFKRALKEQGSVQLNKQWLPLTHPNFEGVQGRVELSVEVLPDSDARSKAAGPGRDEPNQNPFLPEPDRPNSVAPWDVMGQMKLRWKKYRWYAYGFCCFLLLIFCFSFYVKVA